MAYQAYPYRGEQPPGLLDNLLEWLGSVISSDPFPPGHLASSDMSTRTDMRPDLIKRTPIESLEEQLTAMPPGLISDPPDPNLSLSPAQKKALAIAAAQTGFDFLPGSGEYLSGQYAQEEAQRAAEAFRGGDILKGTAHAATVPFEIAGAVPAAGVVASIPRDIYRGAKRFTTAITDPNKLIEMYNPRAITDPTLNLRERPLDEAIGVARTERHIKKQTDGSYVGAPAFVRSAGDIQKMRDDFDAQVFGGVLGADWYQRAREGIRKMKGGGPRSKRARQQTADELAVFSAQADPDPNLGWQIQLNNAWAGGVSPLPMARTPEQTRKVRVSRMSGDPVKLGLKTGIYGKGINPDLEFTTTGTNDIWHGRAFGYTNADGSTFDRGFSPQEHAFLDAETVLAVDRMNQIKLGGRDDWSAPEIQAAAWVNAKGNSKFDEFPDKFASRNDAVKWASETYPDSFPKFTMQATSEQIPGKDTGQFPGLLTAPQATKEAYSRAAPWEDEEGRDVILDELGLSVLPSKPAMGAYKNRAGQFETNDAMVQKPLVSLLDDEGGRIVDPISEDLVNIGQGIRGYFDVQNMSAAHKAIPIGSAGSKAGAAGSHSIKMDRPLTEQEMVQMQKVLDPYGLGISDTGEGITLMQFDSTRGEKLADDLSKRNTPLGSVNKVFSPTKAGTIEQIRFKLKQDLTKEQKKFITDLRHGRAQFKVKTPPGKPQQFRTDTTKYKVKVKDRNVTITQVASPGKEMDQMMAAGLSEDIDRVLPGRGKSENIRLSSPAVEWDFTQPGSGAATRQLEQLVTDPRYPRVMQSLDNSPRLMNKVMDLFQRDTFFNRATGDPLRSDVQRAREIFINGVATGKGGFTELFKALKNGAVLPAVALPILGLGLRQDPDERS